MRLVHARTAYEWLYIILPVINDVVSFETLGMFCYARRFGDPRCRHLDLCSLVEREYTALLQHLQQRNEGENEDDMVDTRVFLMTDRRVGERVMGWLDRIERSRMELLVELEAAAARARARAEEARGRRRRIIIECPNGIVFETEIFM